MHGDAGTALLGQLAHLFMPLGHGLLLVDGLAQDRILVLDEIVMPLLCAIAHFLVTLLPLRYPGFALFQHGIEAFPVALIHGLLALACFCTLDFILQKSPVKGLAMAANSILEAFRGWRRSGRFRSS